MNRPLDTRARESEMADPQHAPVRIIRKANGGIPNQGRFKLRWLDVTVRTINSRRDDLELIHWKKVWHSLDGE